MPTLNRIQRADITDTSGGREVLNVDDIVNKMNDLIEAINTHNEALSEVKEFFDSIDSAAREAASDVDRAT